jgi:hypothetical protein
MSGLKQILKFFPKIKLSYEKILDKKVYIRDYAEAYMLIPKGLKAFIWFTNDGEQNLAYLLKMDLRGKITDFEKLTLVFDDNLALGTILFGTIFHINGRRFFACENIFYYRGENIYFFDFKNKLNYLTEFFCDKYRQVTLSNSMITIGMCILKSTFECAYNEINSLTYPIYAIRSFRFNSGNSLGNFLIKNKAIEAIFNVMASVESDIYYLYGESDSEGRLANVSSCKTSLLLNSLFRNIRENSNIDYIEESEDEDEFQESNDEKYVNLNLIIKMRCVFNAKFKKWEPVKIAQKKDQLIKLNDLAKIETLNSKKKY